MDTPADDGFTHTHTHARLAEKSGMKIDGYGICYANDDSQSHTHTHIRKLEHIKVERANNCKRIQQRKR